MGSIKFRGAALGVACAAAVMLGGCTKLRSHQGYITDADLINSVQAGVDNRDSVRSTLGTPTFVGQFDENEWFYLGRDSRNFAYNRPNPVDQTVIRVRFDQAGNVTAVTREGMENVVAINPTDRKTPTLGRDRSFFQDLFGNIGTVGAGGPPPQQN